MLYMKKAFFAFAFVLGVSLAAACGGDEGGNGGTGGNGATGGSPPPANTVRSLCERLDECNELIGMNVMECIDLTEFCLDENFPTTSLRNDWELLTEQCLDFSTCAVFVNCWLNDVPIC